MFYDIFRTLCEKKGVSCHKAALDIGLSNATPTIWKKRNITPKGDTLSKIAEYFGVSIDYLLGSECEKKPTENGEREISKDDLKFALWGDSSEIDDADLDDVLRYAAFIKERKQKNDG